MPLLIGHLLSASSRRGLHRRPLDWHALALHLLLHPRGHVELLGHLGCLGRATLTLKGPAHDRGSPLPLGLQRCLQTRRILHREGDQQLVGVEMIGVRVDRIQCKLEIYWPPIVILPHYLLVRWHLLCIQGFVLFWLITRLRHSKNHWVRIIRSWLIWLI